MKTKQTGEFKIVKGIPMPHKGNSSGIGKVLKEMEIGDSFFVAGRRPYGNILAYHRPKKFATRAVKDGFRVWRIS